MFMNFQSIEQKPDHHFRAEIPNIVFHLGLDCYELAVYSHLKRISGDEGCCFKTIANLAKDCRVSDSKLKYVIHSLENPRDLLNGMPLIQVTKRKKENGSPDSNIINIVPIWRINGDHFRVENKNVGGGGSPKTPGWVTKKPRGGSCGDPKEEPKQEDLKEEQQQAPSSPFVRSPSSIQSKQVEPDLQQTGYAARKEILAEYSLTTKDFDSIRNLPVNQILNACEAFDQYMISRKKSGEIVANPTGALLNAIRGSWVPNYTKADIDVGLKEERNRIEDLVARNRIHAIDAGYSVKDNDYGVWIWNGKVNSILELSESEDFVKSVVNQYPPKYR